MAVKELVYNILAITITLRYSLATLPTVVGSEFKLDPLQYTLCEY
jgi:hypothetical protein